MDGNLLGIYLEDISDSLKSIRSQIKRAAEAARSGKGANNVDKRVRSVKGAIADCEKSMSIFESELSQCRGDERRDFEKRFAQCQSKLARYKDEIEQIAQGTHSPSQSPSSPSSPSLTGRKEAQQRGQQQQQQFNNDIELAESSARDSSNRGRRGAGTELKMAKRGDVKMLDEIHDVQDETNAALDRIIRLNETTLQIASDTAAKLKEQTERIIETQKNLDDLGSETKRARKELNSFMRQLAKDKVFMLILCLMAGLALCLMIAYIVIRIVAPDLLDPKKLFAGGGGEGGKAEAEALLSAAATWSMNYIMKLW